MQNHFTLESFINQLKETPLMKGIPFSSFDLIELGIRCSKSYNTIYKQPAEKITKEIQGKNKMITLLINEYPEDFKPQVIKILDKYLWQRRTKRLVTMFQWNKQKEEWLTKKANQYRK
jgi:hypothetical protein